MCLIAYNPTGRPMLREAIDVVYKNNSDGFGLAYPDTEGRIKVIRGLFDADEIWRILQFFRGTAHAWHVRFRTRGEVGEQACHPFVVLDKEKHGEDVVMFHNGTLNNVPMLPGKSDSQVFALMLRGQLIKYKNPAATLRDPRHLSNMERVIKSWNKLLFLFADGNALIVNEKAGVWRDNIWFSNTYSFDKDWRIKNATSEHGCSNRSKRTTVSTSKDIITNRNSPHSLPAPVVLSKGQLVIVPNRIFTTETKSDLCKSLIAEKKNQKGRSSIFAQKIAEKSKALTESITRIIRRDGTEVKRNLVNPIEKDNAK